jgi:hypothetical protein
MFWRFITRRSIARLAVCLLVFASVQAVLTASAAHGARRVVDVTAFSTGTACPHDHSVTVCHTCAGHICLEQHCVVNQGSAPPALLTALTITIEPWPAAEAWAHPATAPPRATFVHSVSLPRAPPELS